MMSNLRTAVRKSGGFGLIEVLISMLLISFSVLGLSTLQVNMLRNARFSQDQLNALYLAESHMEQIRANRHNIERSELIGYREVSAGRDYLIASTVTNHSSVDQLALIEVNVSWSNSLGSRSEIVLNSALYLGAN